MHDILWIIAATCAVLTVFLFIEIIWNAIQHRARIRRRLNDSHHNAGSAIERGLRSSIKR